MNNTYKKIYILAILLFTLPSCKQVYENANSFMNSYSFERLVNRFESPERDAYQKPDKVIEYIGDVKGETIMDIGAGTGYFAFRLADAGAKVIAADVDDRFLNYMKEKIDTLQFNYPIELRKVPYDSPLLQDAEANKVIIVNTYHHIEDRSNYFAKVKNGLKSNGKLIVIDFFKKKLKIGPPKRHKVSVEEVIEELKKAGFTQFQKETELLEYQYIITAS